MDLPMLRLFAIHVICIQSLGQLELPRPDNLWDISTADQHCLVSPDAHPLLVSERDKSLAEFCGAACRHQEPQH